MVHRERRIQEIAYLLWEREGRPEGQEERHWHEAVAQYESEHAHAAKGRVEHGATPAPSAPETPSLEEKRVTAREAEEAAPLEDEPVKSASKKPAGSKGKAAEAAEPVEKPKTVKPKSLKPMARKSKDAKPEDGEAPSAVAARTSEGEPAIKSAKPKAGKRKG